MDNTILCNAILDTNSSEAVDLDGDPATISGHVDTQALVLEKRRQIDMEVSLRNTSLINVTEVIYVLGFVEGIRVQRFVGDDVVL